MVTHRDECVQRFRHLGGAGDGITECLLEFDTCDTQVLDSYGTSIKNADYK